MVPTQIAADLLTGSGRMPSEGNELIAWMKASVTGAPDPLYVQARRTLRDALDALEPRLDAIVLVGGQAVHLHSSGRT